MSKKKAEQLGMPQGTASNRLRKMIMFSLIQETKKDSCFQCGEKIVDIDNLSVEHKAPWLNSNDPVSLFFDLNNIAFSHLTCNVSAKRTWNKGSYTIPEHGTLTRYKDSRFLCRCTACRKANSDWLKEYRKRGEVAEFG